jgi:Double zinc ribbon
VSAERRCPTCGALVTSDAEWCGQCFTNLATARPPPDGEGASARGSKGGDVEPGPARPATVESADAPGTAYWTCPACGERNSLDLDACTTCGTPFTRLFDAEREPVSVPRGTAVAWSLLYPGLGHRLVGRAGDGVARASVFTLALGAMVFLLLARGDNDLGPLLGFLSVYGLFAIGIYAFTAVEAGHLADGGDPFASPRGFAWVAAALVVVSLGVAVYIAVGATRGR